MKGTLVLAATFLLPGLAHAQFREDPAVTRSTREWIEKTKDPDPEVRRHAALVLKDRGRRPCPRCRAAGRQGRWRA